MKFGIMPLKTDAKSDTDLSSGLANHEEYEPQKKGLWNNTRSKT